MENQNLYTLTFALFFCRYCYFPEFCINIQYIWGVHHLKNGLILVCNQGYYFHESCQELNNFPNTWYNDIIFLHVTVCLTPVSTPPSFLGLVEMSYLHISLEAGCVSRGLQKSRCCTLAASTVQWWQWQFCSSRSGSQQTEKPKGNQKRIARERAEESRPGTGVHTVGGQWSARLDVGTVTIWNVSDGCGKATCHQV